MRELKFRAWDGDYKRMRYNVSVKDGVAQWRENDNTILTHDVMQYTGLRDKDNKEIYEGDIVMYDGQLCEVVWRDHGSVYGRKVGYTCRIINSSCCQYLTWCYGPITIVGNIYLNKGLCK